MTDTLADAEQSSLNPTQLTIGKAFEFKERTLPNSSIVTQLKLFFNDCDRRSIHLLQKSERYQWYSRYTVFTSTSMLLGSAPFIYWLFATEYSVARTRRPAKVKNYWTIASMLFFGSTILKFFALSNSGFGKQAMAIQKFSEAYDVLGWEARRFQVQLEQGTFDGDDFIMRRKLEYEIADDEQAQTALQLHKADLASEDRQKSQFSDLLLREDLDERTAGLQTAATRREKRKIAFETRAVGEGKLSPSTVAYYEFCDRKKVLDDWY